MAVAYIREFDVGADRTTSNYDEVQRRMRLDENPAEGLIVHAAGFTGSKFRMLEIWESAELEERFASERSCLLSVRSSATPRRGQAPRATSCTTS
ncbi:MAG TPA: hypothetical protein VGV40_00460 [Solirubrobacteraceae bacterium]|nr:hypothetical protein [Solirubrobacteraceae bacterium]